MLELFVDVLDTYKSGPDSENGEDSDQFAWQWEINFLRFFGITCRSSKVWNISVNLENFSEMENSPKVKT